MKRISLRLFLAVITFLIGISLTMFWMFIYHPKNDVSTSLVAVSDSTNNQVEALSSYKPTFKDEDIELQYAWSLMGKDALDGIFYVKNNSNETIHYLGYDQNDNRRCWIKQGSKVEATNLPNGDGIKEQELKPNESITFTIPVPQNDKPFEAGFSFQIGNERNEKTIWVKVKKQLKSFGIPCNEYVMKQGGVLSKTCITVSSNRLDIEN